MKKNQKYVYVALLYIPSAVGRFVKFWTRYGYSHVTFSFDENLETNHAFSRVKEFTPGDGTSTYTLDDVGYSKQTMVITYEKGEDHESVAGDGTKTLSVGDNSFDVVVTAQDGTTKTTYTINVYKKSNNANLSTLTVNELADVKYYIANSVNVFDDKSYSAAKKMLKMITEIIKTKEQKRKPSFDAA